MNDIEAGANNVVPLKPVGEDLHAFLVAGRRYVVNASNGQAYPVAEDGLGEPGQGLSQDELRQRQRLDAVSLADLPTPAPPNGIGSVLLNVTHRCNLACSYCIMEMPELQTAYHDERRSLNDDNGRSCIDFLAREGYPDHVSVTFFGGEPLLKYDLITRIVDYAERAYPGRFTYQLITNGCLMKPEMHDFFRRHNFSFLWSLDGEPEVHDRLRHFKSTPQKSVFAVSFKALEDLRRAWPEVRVGVNVTYFKQTIELPAALRFFRQHGIRQLRMDRGLVPRESPHAVGMEEVGKVNGQLRELAADYLALLRAGEVFTLNPFVNNMRIISKRLPRHRACNSGLDYVTITAKGEVYSCYKLLGIDDCRLGDVKSGFSRDASLDLWNRLDVNERPGCSRCWARHICAGGCTADNLHLNHSYFVPTRENCAIFLNAIELSIDLYFTLLQERPDVLKALLGSEHLADNDVPTRREGIVIHEDDRLDNLEDGGSYRLNDSARLIFDLADGEHSLADIAEALVDAYDIPLPLALMDCREQLFALARAGLVVIPEAPPLRNSA